MLGFTVKERRSDLGNQAGTEAKWEQKISFQTYLSQQLFAMIFLSVDIPMKVVKTGFFQLIGYYVILKVLFLLLWLLGNCGPPF